jgi:epoxide hydrolase-like protein
VLRQLCEHWQTTYDWRATERRINRLPHYRTVIDGLSVHFIHVRSPVADAVPLIMTHGWPGSFLEFEQVVERLADPVAFGDMAADTRILPGRFTSRAMCLDPGEGLDLVRSRGRSVGDSQSRSGAGQHHAVLADPDGRLVSSAVLGEHRGSHHLVHQTRWRAHHGTHWMHRLPTGGTTPLPAMGRAPVPINRSLGRASPRRPLRRLGTTWPVHLRVPRSSRSSRNRWMRP